MNQLPDDATTFNRRAWDNIAKGADRWFTAVTSQQIDDARQDQWRIKVTPTLDVPRVWFGNVSGKQVLCLACGGGQQAPLLAAAGARVTVVDNSDRQLERDRKIASDHQLNIQCVNADMRSLSEFRNASFDLILNPTSVCYVDQVGCIWSECFRCLAPGGRLILGAINPCHYIFDAIARDQNRLIVRHRIPYSDLQLSDEERRKILSDVRPIEFGHSLQDLLGGPLETGFELTGFYTDRWGDEDCLSDHIDTFIAALFTKPC